MPTVVLDQIVVHYELRKLSEGFSVALRVEHMGIIWEFLQLGFTLEGTIGGLKAAIASSDILVDVWPKLYTFLDTMKE